MLRLRKPARALWQRNVSVRKKGNNKKSGYKGKADQYNWAEDYEI